MLCHVNDNAIPYCKSWRKRQCENVYILYLSVAMIVAMYFYKRLITSFIVHQPIIGNYCYPNARELRNFASRSKLFKCYEHKSCSYVQSRSFSAVSRNPKVNGSKILTVFKYNSTLTPKTKLSYRNDLHSNFAPRPKTSELRRLLRLAHPEKWTLTGEQKFAADFFYL